MSNISTSAGEYFRSNRALLIVGGLLLIVGVWADILWFSYHPSLHLYLINLLPGSILLFGWYLASKFEEKRWVFIIVGILLAIIVSLYATFINLGAAALAAYLEPKEDVARYPEIREQFGDSPLIQHFPQSIPANAIDVRFYYLPGFMQGGTSIQLRYQLPHEEIIDLLARYRSEAAYHFQGGNKTDHENQPGGVPTTFFYTGDVDKYSFPPSYEILVLDAQSQGTPDFEWNHGYSFGVAVDAENSIIVYWVEDW